MARGRMDNETEIKTLRLQVAGLEKQVSELSAKLEGSKKPIRQPDLVHHEWAIDQRAKIQHKLLALYRQVLKTDPKQADWTLTYLSDHLISAAFSLWRAVFLAENVRDEAPILEAQKNFLETVISTNAITFPDDRRNSAWTVSFYLENAKHRIMAAHHLAEHYFKGERLDMVLPLVRLKGTNDVKLTRYEWESIHAALRILLKILDPKTKLPVDTPTIPVDE
jgi:hypothetical protein